VVRVHLLVVILFCFQYRRAICIEFPDEFVFGKLKPQVEKLWHIKFIFKLIVGQFEILVEPVSFIGLGHLESSSPIRVKFKPSVKLHTEFSLQFGIQRLHKLVLAGKAGVIPHRLENLVYRG
jgi:hypothetical protein